MKNISTLSNSDLFVGIKRLVGIERDNLAEILRYLHEIDSRKLYLELGYPSLFMLCTKGLGYSESAAMRRIRAARCVSETPEVLEKISTGALSLCSVAEISKVDATERSQVIQASAGKSTFEVQKIVALKLPEKPQREKVRVSAVEAPLFTPASEPPPVENRYTVTLQLDEEQFRLLQEVRTMTSQKSISGAFMKALRLYRKLRSPIERHKRREKRKEKKVAQSSQRKTVRRAIPAESRDAVMVRDGCQCTFEVSPGIRCPETSNLNVDHIMPYSIGGGHEIENLRVMCGAHNRHLYDKFLELNSSVESRHP